MKLKTLLLTGFVSIGSTGFTQMNSYSHEWAAHAGSDEYDMGIDIVTGTDGNIYTTGKFQASADMQPGAGTHYIHSGGLHDVYIAKYDDNQNLIWAQSFGGAFTDEPVAIDIDDSLNVYVVGRFGGSVDFDPSLYSQKILVANNPSDTYSTFIVKLDKDGNLVWAQTIDNKGNTVAPKDITVDRLNNIHVAGQFNDTAIINRPLLPSVVLSTPSVSSYCITYNEHGRYLKHYSNDFYSNIESVEVDNNFNQYFIGLFGGTVDFDPGLGTKILTSSTSAFYSNYIMKLNPMGYCNWARTFQTIGSSRGVACQVDNDGNVYSVGEFYYEIDLNPNASYIPVSVPYNNQSMYVSKLNKHGFYVWGNIVTGTMPNVMQIGKLYPKDLCITSSGDCFATGGFAGSADFDPSSGLDTINTGDGDRYIPFTSLYSSNGNYVKTFYAERTTGKGLTYSNAIAINAVEEVYTTGIAASTMNFRPTSSIPYYLTPSSSDMYMQKLKLNTGQVVPPIFRTAEDGNADCSIKMYPNPAADIVTIMLQEDEPAILRIYDNHGVLVVSLNTNQDRMQVSLETLASGMFVVEVTQGEKVHREKLVKL